MKHSITPLAELIIKDLGRPKKKQIAKADCVNRGHISVVLSALLLVFIVSGCGTLRTYDGPPLSPDRVARLSPIGYAYGNSTDFRVFGNPQLRSKLSLQTVNGKSAYGRTVELLPGTHEIMFTGVRRHSISCDLAAGKDYELQGRYYGPKDVEFFVVEKDVVRMYRSPLPPNARPSVIEAGEVRERLEGEPIQPVFRKRK